VDDLRVLATGKTGIKISDQMSNAKGEIQNATNGTPVTVIITEYYY